ncbi:MAG: hypothetical protein ACYC27_14520 [Armatimonadota bacterium]
MLNRLFVVQFIHPGGEHTPGRGVCKKWNTKQHKRKFMKTSGEYVADGKILKGDIGFWGEWEPESEVIARISNPLPNGPRYIYRPFYILPKDYKNDNLQNTDPFVFGDQFFYSICQQTIDNKPTGMQTLDKGTLILFGSCKQKQFHLDTVFVVSHWIDHDQNSFEELLKGVVSDTYLAVTLYPWYNNQRSSGCKPSNAQSFRLYFGATISKPVNGMYSFFPCQPYEPGTRGFERPVIRIPGIITDTLPQGRKMTQYSNIDDVKVKWDMVVKQVKNAGQSLGVHADLPECIQI